MGHIRSVSMILLIALLGCSSDTVGPAGSSDSGGFITVQQAMSVPPGSASGSAFGGVFTPVTNTIVDCQCEADSTTDGVCETIRPTIDTSLSFELQQNNGTLTGLDPSGAAFVGGVDSDGSFTLGGVVPFLDLDNGNRIGDAATLIEGQFSDAGFFWSMIAHVRSNSDGVQIDCQVWSEVTARRI